MDAPRDDDPEEDRFGSEEWEGRRESRHGHPTGHHVQQHDDEGTPRVSDYLRNGGRAELRGMLDEMRVGASPAAPPKPDWWKWIGGAVAVVGLIITIAGSAISIVASNQKLLDKIDGMDERLKVVEAGRLINVPKLDEQIRDNKLQDQRIQNAVDANSDERKARQESDVETRKAQADILALVARLTERVNDLATEQAVQRERQRRGALAASEHDAQATQVPGSHPR